MSTIDERLDRLTERHEALTHTVELLLRQAGDNDARLERLRERHEALTHTIELVSQQSAENEKRYYHRFENIASTLESLLKIVQSHEGRIRKLESDSAA